MPSSTPSKEPNALPCNFAAFADLVFRSFCNRLIATNLLPFLELIEKSLSGFLMGFTIFLLDAEVEASMAPIIACSPYWSWKSNKNGGIKDFLSFKVSDLNRISGSIISASASSLSWVFSRDKSPATASSTPVWITFSKLSLLSYQFLSCDKKSWSSFISSKSLLFVSLTSNDVSLSVSGSGLTTACVELPALTLPGNNRFLNLGLILIPSSSSSSSSSSLSP